jgi:O-methyltransferase
MVDKIWKEISTNNILGYNKSKLLYIELLDCIKLEGSTAEIGVYEGNTSKMIKLLNNDKTHYCYDTFEGIIGSDNKHDTHENGKFYCNLDKVKRNINLGGVIYKKGYFPETFNEDSEKFCFVYSDTSTYIGTKNTLLYLHNNIVIGGKIICYSDDKCKGVKEAIDEFSVTNTDFSMYKISNFLVLTRKRYLSI